MPDRPQTIGFSTGVGLHRTHRRMSESLDRDDRTWHEPYSGQSWCETSSDRIRPFSTNFSLPKNNEKGQSRFPIDDVREYEIEWLKPDNFNLWDDKKNDIDCTTKNGQGKGNIDKTDFVDDTCIHSLSSSNQLAVGIAVDKTQGINKLKLSTLWSKKKNSSLSQIEEEQYMTINKTEDSIFICTENYEAQNPWELSMKKGEIIEGFSLLTFIAWKHDSFHVLIQCWSSCYAFLLIFLW